MKRLKFTTILALAALLMAAGLASCKIGQSTIFIPVTVPLTCSATPENYFNGLSSGLELTVTSDVTNNDIYDPSGLGYSEVQIAAAKNSITYFPGVKQFVEESLGSYIRAAGISLGRDRENDYRLTVRVREFKFIPEKKGARTTIVLDYTLTNTDNEVIMQKTARGRYIVDELPNKDLKGLVVSLPSEAFDKAYSQAVNAIDWVGIADALKVHGRADQEKHRQVKGDGDTALEQTVIRWYIISSPAGADVSWRVVSSTPDVKNTNAIYMGTTPYESTESFDIRGLKFENSGNVQIEVTCEKPGYLPQRRRFNLRQAIEQREISAKFNLVKEDE